MSCFAVDLGRTNIYVAVEQIGLRGISEPRVLELEQVAEDGMARFYRPALPAAACRDQVGYRVGERARHLLCQNSAIGTIDIREGLGENNDSAESLVALLRYLKHCVEQDTGREHGQIVLVGVDVQKQQLVAASCAAAADLEVASSGFVDWVEAALLDCQVSPPAFSYGDRPGKHPWLLILDVGGRATEAALLKITMGESRLVVSNTFRSTIAWGGRNIDKCLTGMMPGTGQDLVHTIGRAREEIIQLLDDGIHPGLAHASVTDASGIEVEVSAAGLEAAVIDSAQKSLLLYLQEFLATAGGSPEVLLVGGGSRHPALASWIHDTLGLRVWQPVEPELALVRGAVLSFAMRRGRV